MMAQHSTEVHSTTMPWQYGTAAHRQAVPTTLFLVSQPWALGTRHQTIGNQSSVGLCIQTSGSHRPRVDNGWSGRTDTAAQSPRGTYFVVPILLRFSIYLGTATRQSLYPTQSCAISHSCSYEKSAACSFGATRPEQPTEQSLNNNSIK